MMSSTVVQIDTIDCELSIYRKGCLSIHVDLVNSLVTWRESKQWCNSFTRTVSETSRRELLTFIQSSALLNEILDSSGPFAPIDTLCQLETKAGLIDNNNRDVKGTAGQKPDEEQAACLIPAVAAASSDEQFNPSDWYQYVDQKKSSWQIVMTAADKQYSQAGHFPLPKGWTDFQRILEKVSRAPFRLF